jgi:DNA repair exonuclease SbcCD ATPase subunit
MIIIKEITIKNFLSVGNVTQKINFNRNDLTLILGENRDLGGDGARNGTGKSTIVQALCYALYGGVLNNIKKDNLVNLTNGKGMLVTVDFEVNGSVYRIERGRKPNILKFYVDNNEQQFSEDESESQGDSRETQLAIESIIGISAEMFKHIVALNTYNEPFLALKAADQREIIEQLLGITLLSEKAEGIKELNRTVKEQIQREEFKIRGLQDANSKIQEQIDSLKRRQTLWVTKKDEDIANYTTQLVELYKIDIEKEIASHRSLVIYNDNQTKLTTAKTHFDSEMAKLSKRYNDAVIAYKREKDNVVSQMNSLKNIDIHNEISNLKIISEIKEKTITRDNTKKLLDASNATCARLNKEISTINAELLKLYDHKCYACGQDYHDETHKFTLKSKEERLAELQTELTTAENQSKEYNTILNGIGTIPPMPSVNYKTLEEAINHKSSIDSLADKTTKLQENFAKTQSLYENDVDALNKQYDDIVLQVGELGAKPTVVYSSLEAALKHQNTVEKLEQSLEKRVEEVDPYADQITDMEKNSITVISYDTVNELTRTLKHQEYLLDLLTNKKSFVRKKIIEQNLNYLNSRLTLYLDKMGLPHRVKFQNDLSVEITELGRELSYGNFSRGESTRLILSLSFAFRDVWENLYQGINLLFVDEMIDNGLDSVGVENAIGLFKELGRRRDKSVWLISHRDELMSRVSNVLHVIKEGGFTRYSNHHEKIAAMV